MNTVHAIVDQYAGEKLEIGKRYQNSRDGLVEVISGTFYDTTYGRVSNWWTWRKVGPDGQMHGPDISGYGWDVKTGQYHPHPTPEEEEEAV